MKKLLILTTVLILSAGISTGYGQGRGVSGQAHFSISIDDTYRFERGEMKYYGDIYDTDNSRNVDVNLYSTDGERIYFEMHVPDADRRLAAGTYTFDSDYAPFSYSRISVNDSDYSAQGGSVTVSVSDDIYTLTIDCTFDGGGVLRGNYTGPLDFENQNDDERDPLGEGQYSFDGDTYPLEWGEMKYYGNIYSGGARNVDVNLRSNDGSRLYFEMHVPRAFNRLAAGTYIYDDNYSEFSYSSASVNDGDYSISDGAVIVTVSDDVYTITVNCRLDNGDRLTGEYVGTMYWSDNSSDDDDMEPLGEGQFSMEGESHPLEWAETKYYGSIYSSGESRNVDLNLRSSEGSRLYFEMHVPYTFNTLAAGTYIYDDDYPAFSYSRGTVNNGDYEITDGTVNVSVDGEIYTITIDGTLDNGERITGRYVGSDYWTDNSSSDSEEEAEPLGEGELYFNGDTYPLIRGEMRYYGSNFSTEGSKNVDITLRSNSSRRRIYFEMHVPDTYKRLAPGVYTYSESYSPFTYSQGSANDGDYSITGGTVTVEVSGDTYTVTLNCVVDGDELLTGKYTGEFHYTDESNDPIGEGQYRIGRNNYDLVSGRMTYYGDIFDSDNACNVDLRLSSSDGTDIYFEMHVPGEYDRLTAGSYILTDSHNAFTFSEGSANDGDHEVTSGTVTVSVSGDTYTITMDCTLDNGDKLRGEYTGALRWSE